MLFEHKIIGNTLDNMAEKEEIKSSFAPASAEATAGKKATEGKEEIQKKLEESEKKALEYLAGWQRARADFLNYKKEEMERIGEFFKYANLNLILKFLPILDNFEIAEKKLPENIKNEENVKGILQIKNQILDFLKNQGVEEIKSVGEKFDPNFHEIIGEVSPSEASAKEGEFSEPGTIIEEIQKGYKINSRLLRPAKIKVIK